MGKETIHDQNEADEDESLPTVVVPLVLCPACRCEDIEVRSSYRRSNGSRVRYCHCRDCRSAFRVIHEYPTLELEG